ncbi:MAG: exonuclease domain-containing protein [Verrucomicrobia bacterium]|nr:exonuclease domain-containing protein [Verrucomicrobiota bacterium]
METTPTHTPGNYLWFDTEFTTLELESAHVLQIALIVTDANLKRLAPPEQDFKSIVRLDDGVRCTAWVEENLSGLLAQCRGPNAEPIAAANHRLGAYLDGILGPPSDQIRLRPVLAGNSIQADWYLARKFLPALVDRMHYRVLDVSSWKVFWGNEVGAMPFDKDNADLLRQFFPGDFNSSQDAHDAHFDVLASIAELNFYKTHQTIHWPPAE